MYGVGVVLCAGLLFVLALLVAFARTDFDPVGLGGVSKPPDGFDAAANILYQGALPVSLCGFALIVLFLLAGIGRRSRVGS